MIETYQEVLRDKLDSANYAKLMALKNEKLHRFVAEAIELCRPDSVFVVTDEPEDVQYIREQTIETGEEIPLNIDGHTVHFDGYFDQGRDKLVTKYLLPKGVTLGANLNSIDKTEGVTEVKGIMKNSMQGKTMLVRFFCLGPTFSQFSISGVQITDSFYVGHSEDLLYRSGYEQFGLLGNSANFFRVLHSCGEVDEKQISVNKEDRRIYIDLEDEIVYSVNTQYAGNTVGFKKLSLRLAINKADREGWLAEHMFIMGINGPNRKTYFTGAFPSACGKTSTAMLPGECIVGDDIAYLRVIDGRIRTVNVECGIFGIIKDVNPTDDPVIYEVLTSPGEVIFSNVLVKEGTPYWLGMGKELPETGYNHSGEWFKGKKGPDGAEVDPSHKNARYTVRLRYLANLDEKADDPEGILVDGIIYGGRDSDTMVPVVQSFDWMHGVMLGASLESETTSATIGQEGVRSFQPMSNLDFVAIPLGKYIANHLQFVKDLAVVPKIFAVNYFLKDKNGKYLNGMLDKKIWIRWMEERIHGDVQALWSPVGLIPEYADLKRLFKTYLDKEYTEANYTEQFKIRVAENLAKLDRIEAIYRSDVKDTPEDFYRVLDEQRQRLLDAQKLHGAYISPMIYKDEKIV